MPNYITGKDDELCRIVRGTQTQYPQKGDNMKGKPAPRMTADQRIAAAVVNSAAIQGITEAEAWARNILTDAGLRLAPKADVDLLATDITQVASDIDRPGSALAGKVELMRRIGGIKNLASYMASLWRAAELKQAPALNADFLTKVEGPIWQCWGDVASDACSMGGRMTNWSAMEIVVDANRLESMGGQGGEEADNLIGAACKTHGYAKVMRFLCKNIKLV